MKLLNWMPAILWALLIFLQSNDPSPRGADIAPDYLLHFFAYGILALAIILGFSGGIKYLWRGQFSGRHLLLSFLLAAAYGFSDEWHQSFIPGRHASWADIAANSLGALSIAFLLLIWKKWRDSSVNQS